MQNAFSDHNIKNPEIKTNKKQEVLTFENNFIYIL